MTTNRKITIFLASSEELINDRNSFSDLIRSLDDIYEDRGIRIKLKRWEDFFAYCTGTRTQDQYNQVLSASDMCICLFHTRAGQFTIEEFHHAMAEYQRTGDHPKTYVYARALVEGEVEEEELKQFKDELFKQMGHYWCNYATEDSMKLHFIMQFERLINDTLGQREDTQNLSIEQGNVMLHGRKVADYNNIPFAANNTEVIALKEKIAALDKDIVALRSIGNDALTPMINEKADERHHCQEQLEQLEKQLLDTALSISKMISSDKPISERKRAAIEMFEQGNNRGVLDILNEEDIERDIQSAKNKLAIGAQIVDDARNEIRSLVEEYLLKAKTWMSTYSEEKRFDEACKCYEQAILHTRENLTDEELAERLHEYGKFLQDNKQFHQIETYYQEALSIYERLATTCPDTFKPKLAETLNFCANLYADTQRLDEAEEYYLRALEIRKQLADSDPETYEPDLAKTMNSIAVFYSDTQRFNEAEAYHLGALDIRERLASSNPKVYEFDLSTTLNNLATLYDDKGLYNQAETHYLRALEIRERLANSNPEAYEYDLTITLNNLGILYSNMQRYAQAEEYHLRALEIRKRLAKAHPEAYESDLAISWHNLAGVYSDTQRFDEAEEHYLQALRIRKQLATTYPEAYESDLAMTLHNLAGIYRYTQHLAQAEEHYLRALEIYERLAKAHPEAYKANLAMILNSLGALYHDLQRFYTAKKHYLRALKTYECLASQWPDVYTSKVKMVLGNLRILKDNMANNQNSFTHWEKRLGK